MACSGQKPMFIGKISRYWLWQATETKEHIKVAQLKQDVQNFEAQAETLKLISMGYTKLDSGQQVNKEQGEQRGEEAHAEKQAENGPESILHHLCGSCCLVRWYEGGVNQTDHDVTEQKISHHQRQWRKIWVCICVCLCVWRAVPGQELTSADGAIAHVARLAGTQVSSDGVGADGVLITQILPAGALVMLWGRDRERNSTVRISVCLCVFVVWKMERSLEKSFLFELSSHGNAADERTCQQASWLRIRGHSWAFLLSTASFLNPCFQTPVLLGKFKMDMKSIL